MDSKRPVILGYDAVSPLGTDMEHQWQRAVQGESGIGELTRFPLREGFPVRIAGQVDEIDCRPYPFLSSRSLAQWTSPIFKYALLVVHRALRKSGIEITPELAPRVAVTFGSAIGGLDAVIAADRLLTATGRLPHPFTNPNSCINMVGGKISMLTEGHGTHCRTDNSLRDGSTSLIMEPCFWRRGWPTSRSAGLLIFPWWSHCCGLCHDERRLSAPGGSAGAVPTESQLSFLYRSTGLCCFRRSGLRYHCDKRIRKGSRIPLSYGNGWLGHDGGCPSFCCPQPGNGQALYHRKHGSCGYSAGGHRCD